MLDERSVQTVSTPSNIFKNKRNVEAMLNLSFNQFKFDSAHFQQAFNNVERPVQTPPTFGSTNVLAEHMLKQMLKPFKRAFSEFRNRITFVMSVLYSNLLVRANHLIDGPLPMGMSSDLGPLLVKELDGVQQLLAGVVQLTIAWRGRESKGRGQIGAQKWFAYSRCTTVR